MKNRKINLKDVKIAAAVKGVRGIAGVARLVPCSRVSVYAAVKTPARYPNVYQRLMELVQS